MIYSIVSALKLIDKEDLLYSVPTYLLLFLFSSHFRSSQAELTAFIAVEHPQLELGSG